MANNNTTKASPKNLNIVALEGHLAADANLKQAPEGGVSNCYFRLAVNEGYLRNDGTNAVSYVSCRISGKRAESIAPYLKQGMRLTVTGSLSVWSTKQADGQYSNDCIIAVDQVHFGPQSQKSQQTQAETSQQPAPTQAAPAPQYQQTTAAPQYQQPAPTQAAPLPQYQQATAAPQYQQVAPQPASPFATAAPQNPQPVSAVSAQQGNPFAFDGNPFADGAMNPPFFS